MKAGIPEPTDFELIVVNFLNGNYSRTQDENTEEVRLFRNRLKYIIVPIIATEPCQCLWDRGDVQIVKRKNWNGIREPLDALRLLVNDINNAKLKSILFSGPGESTLIRTIYKEELITGKIKKSNPYRVQNEAVGNLGRHQRIVKLPSGKLIFYKQYIAETLEERVYAALSQSLENGEFEDLRLCGFDNCDRFFLKSHGNQQYCESCSQEAALRANAARVKKHRKKNAEKKRREEARKRLLPFEKFLKLAGGNNANTMEVGRIVKKLGGWKTVDPWLKLYRNGKPAATIWNRAIDRASKDILVVELNIV